MRKRVLNTNMLISPNSKKGVFDALFENGNK